MGLYDVLGQITQNTLNKNIPTANYTGDGFDWTSLIQPAIGAGAMILGAKMQGDAANQASNRQWALIQQELARRNAVQGAMAPTLLHAAGIRNPQQISQVRAALGGGPGMPSATGTPAASIPSTPTSTPAKVLGTAGALGGAGLGLASLAGASALGPIGLAVGGAGALGSIVANQFGKGRRTADQFVKAVEDPLGQQVLPQISQELGDPEKALADLNTAYQNYINQVKAWQAMGGNQAKVATQSLNNPKLQQTIDTLYQQLGSQRPQFG